MLDTIHGARYSTNRTIRFKPIVKGKEEQVEKIFFNILIYTCAKAHR